MLTGRSFKSNLPRAIVMHRSNDEESDLLRKRQETQKSYHDRHARELPPLLPDQPVNMYVEERKQWEPATVVQRDNTPRSYHVKTNDTVYRRNRRHLRPATSDEATNEQEPTCVRQQEGPTENHLQELPKTPAVDVTSEQPPPLRRSTRVKLPVQRYGFDTETS